ncbi:SpoIIE family protein phosphatase [Streptomyces sp. NBC_00842]|uniref:SpoIIE family protein phosphatase n=1 Tax=Streptomyces sp. NBC_00842 TaxID=2975848 RepID=UPI00386EC8E8
MYDPLTETCTIARADHPAPVVVRPDGTVDHPDTPAGPWLGSTDVPTAKAAAAGTNPASSVSEPSSATTSRRLPTSMPASTIKKVTFETAAAVGCRACALSAA